MSKTSTSVKSAWNYKTYDYIQATVPKGKKAELLACAEQNGESLAGMIKRLLEQETGINLSRTTKEDRPS